VKLSAILPVARVLRRELAVTALLLLGVSAWCSPFCISRPATRSTSCSRAKGFARRLAAREAMGVPHTWYGRYGAWLAKVLQGNFGNSIRTGLPVLPEARARRRQHAGTHARLAAPHARHRGSDRRARGGERRHRRQYRGDRRRVRTLGGARVLFGYIVVYVFIHWFGMFPLISGAAAKQPHAWLYFLVPIFVLGTASGTLAELIRHLREELSRVLAEDYIRTARAKGAPVWRHAFKEGF